MDSSRKNTLKQHSSTVDQTQKELKISKDEQSEQKLDRNVSEVKPTGQKLERLSHKDKTAKPKPAAHPIAGNLGHYTKRERVEQKKELLNDKQSILSKSSQLSSSENGQVKIIPKMSISENKSCVNKPTLKQRTCQNERALNSPEEPLGKEKSHLISNTPHSTGYPAKQPIVSSKDHKNAKRKLPQTILKTPTDSLISNDEKLKPSLKHAKKSLVTPAKESNTALKEDSLKLKTLKTGSKKSESVIEQTKLAFKRIKAALKPNKPSSVPSKSTLNETELQIKQNEPELVRTRSESKLRRTESVKDTTIPPSNKIESALEQKKSVAEAVKREQELPPKQSELALKSTDSVLTLSNQVLEQTKSTSRLDTPPLQKIKPTLKQKKLITEKNIKHPSEVSKNVLEKTNSASKLIKLDKNKILQAESAIEKAYLFLEQTKLASEVSTSAYKLSKLALKESKLVKEQTVRSEEQKELLVEQSQPERDKTESRLTPKSTILKSSKFALEESALKSVLKPVVKIPLEQVVSELKENDTVKESIRSILKQPKFTIELNKLALKQIKSPLEPVKLELGKTELTTKEILKTSEPALEPQELTLKPAKSVLEQTELELKNITTKESNYLQIESGPEQTKSENRIKESVPASAYAKFCESALDKTILAFKNSEMSLKKAESELKENVTSKKPSKPTLNHVIPKLEESQSQQKQITLQSELRKLESEKSQSAAKMIIKPSNCVLENYTKSQELSESTLIPNVPSLEQTAFGIKENCAKGRPNLIPKQSNTIIEQKTSAPKLTAIISEPPKTKQDEFGSTTNVIVEPNKSALERTKLALQPTVSEMKPNKSPIEQVESELKENDTVTEHTNLMLQQVNPILEQKRSVLKELASTLEPREKQGISESEIKVLLKLSESTFKETKLAKKSTESTHKPNKSPLENTESEMKDYGIAKDQAKQIFGQNELASNPILYMFESKTRKQRINESVTAPANAILILSESSLAKDTSVLKQTKSDLEKNDTVKESTKPVLKENKPTLELSKLTTERVEFVPEVTTPEQGIAITSTSVIIKTNELILEKDISTLKQTEAPQEHFDSEKENIKAGKTTYPILKQVIPNYEHSKSAQSSFVQELIKLENDKMELVANVIVVPSQYGLHQTKQALESNPSQPNLTQAPLEQAKSNNQTEFVTNAIVRPSELALKKAKSVLQPSESTLMPNMSTLEQKQSALKRIVSVKEIITLEHPKSATNAILTSKESKTEKTKSTLKPLNKLASEINKNDSIKASINSILNEVKTELEQNESALKQIKSSSDSTSQQQKQTNIILNEILKLNDLELEKTELVVELSESPLKLTQSLLEQTMSESEKNDMVKEPIKSMFKENKSTLELSEPAIKKIEYIPEITSPEQEKNDPAITLENVIRKSSKLTLDKNISVLKQTEKPQEQFDSEKENITAKEVLYPILKQIISNVEHSKSAQMISVPEQIKVEHGKTESVENVILNPSQSALSQSKLTFASYVSQPNLTKSPLEQTESKSEDDDTEKVLTNSIVKQVRPILEKERPAITQVTSASDPIKPGHEKIKSPQEKNKLKSPISPTNMIIQTSQSALEQAILELNDWILQPPEYQLTHTNLTFSQTELARDQTLWGLEQSESALEKVKPEVTNPANEEMKSEYINFAQKKSILEPSKLELKKTKLQLEQTELNLDQNKLLPEPTELTIPKMSEPEIVAAIDQQLVPHELKIGHSKTALERTNPEFKKTELIFEQTKPTFQITEPLFQQIDTVLEQAYPELEPIKKKLEQTHPTLQLGKTEPVFKSDLKLEQTKTTLEQSESGLLQNELALDPALKKTNSLHQTVVEKEKYESAFRQTESELELTKWALELTESVLEQTKKGLQHNKPTLKQTEIESEQQKEDSHINGPESEQTKPTLEETVLEVNPIFEQSKSKLELMTKLALESNEPILDQKEVTSEKNDPTLEQTIFTTTKSTFELAQPETGSVATKNLNQTLKLTESVLRPTEWFPEVPSSKIEVTSPGLPLNHPESDLEEKLITKPTKLVSEQTEIALDKTESATEQIEPKSEQNNTTIKQNDLKLPLKIAQASFEQNKVASTCILSFYDTTEESNLEEATLATKQTVLISDETRTAPNKTKLVSEKIKSELEQINPAEGEIGTKLGKTELASEKTESELEQINPAKEQIGSKLDKTELTSEKTESELEQIKPAGGKIGFEADSKLGFKLTSTRLEPIKVTSACYLPLLDTLEPGIELIKTNSKESETVSELEPTKLALELIDSALEQIKVVVVEYAPSSETDKKPKVEIIERGTEQTQSAPKAVINQTKSAGDKKKPVLEQMNPVLMLLHVVPNSQRSERVERVQEQMEPVLEHMDTGTLLEPPKLALQLIESELRQTQLIHEETDAVQHQINMEVEKTLPGSEVIGQSVKQNIPLQRNIELEQIKFERDQSVSELDEIESELEQIESELHNMKLVLALPENLKKSEHLQLAFENTDPNLEQIKIPALDRTKSFILHLNTLALPLTKLELEQDKDVLESVKLEVEYTGHELKHFEQELAQKKSIQGRTDSSLVSTKLAMEQSESAFKETNSLQKQAYLDKNKIESLILHHKEQELIKQASEQTKLSTRRSEIEINQPDIEPNLKAVLQPTANSLEQLKEIESTLKFKELVQVSSQPKIELTKLTTAKFKLAFEQIMPETKQTEPTSAQSKSASEGTELQLEDTISAYSQTEVRYPITTLEQHKSMYQIIKTIGLNKSQPLVSTEFVTEKQVNVPFLLKHVILNDKLTELIPEQQFKLLHEEPNSRSEQSEPTLEYSSLNTSIAITKQENIVEVLEEVLSFTENYNYKQKIAEQRNISMDQLNLKNKPEPEFEARTTEKKISELSVENILNEEKIQRPNMDLYGFEEDTSKQISESFSYGDEETKVESEQYLSVWEITNSLGEIIKPQLILEHPKNKESHKKRELKSTEKLTKTITEYDSFKVEQINATLEQSIKICEHRSLKEKPSIIEIRSEVHSGQYFQSASPSDEPSITKELSSLKVTLSKQKMFTPELLVDHQTQKEVEGKQHSKEKLVGFIEEHDISESVPLRQSKSSKLIKGKEQDENNQVQSQEKYSGPNKEAIENLVAGLQSEHSCSIKFPKHEQEHLVPREMLAELLEKLSVHQFDRSLYVPAEHDGEMSDHSSEKEELSRQISGYDSSKFDEEQKILKRPKYYDQIAKYLSTQVFKSPVRKTESESQDSEQSYKIMQKTSSLAAISLNIVQSIPVHSESKQKIVNQKVKDNAVDEVRKMDTPMPAFPWLIKCGNMKQMSDSICGRDNKDSQFITCTRSLKEDIVRKKMEYTARERKPIRISKEQVEKVGHRPEQPTNKTISENILTHKSKLVQTPIHINESTSTDDLSNRKHAKSKFMKIIWRGLKIVYKAWNSRIDTEVHCPFKTSKSLTKLQWLHQSYSKACNTQLDYTILNRGKKSYLQPNSASIGVSATKSDVWVLNTRSSCSSMSKNLRLI